MDLYRIAGTTAPTVNAVFLNSNITPYPRTNLFYLYHYMENEVHDALQTQPDFLTERFV